MTLIQDFYPSESQFLDAYYESAINNIERLESEGVLPRWAVETIYRYYKDNDILPASDEPSEIVSGFVVVDINAIQDLMPLDEGFVYNEITYKEQCVGLRRDALGDYALLDTAKRAGE
mgnify:FL=1